MQVLSIQLDDVEDVGEGSGATPEARCRPGALEVGVRLGIWGRLAARGVRVADDQIGVPRSTWCFRETCESDLQGTSRSQRSEACFMEPRPQKSEQQVFDAPSARADRLVGSITDAPSKPSPWEEVERQDRRHRWFPWALKGTQALLSVVAHSATSQVTAQSDESGLWHSNAISVSRSKVWFLISLMIREAGLGLDTINRHCGVCDIWCCTCVAVSNGGYPYVTHPPASLRARSARPTRHNPHIPSPFRRSSILLQDFHISVLFNERHDREDIGGCF